MAARSALEAAAALLGRRDFASADLARRLGESGFPAADIEAAIADLQGRRVLDDARFAANFVRWHGSRGHGPVRIRRDLSALGVPGELIESAFAEGPDFTAICQDVRRRRFGAGAPRAWKEKARQGRFLQYRGFSSDHIRSALGSDPDLDPDPDPQPEE
ncbi:MAG: regulatory protein RecX [Steroidobacteraceae bacterium]